MVGPGDWVIADRLVHASIWDGIRLSGAQWRRYAHNDMGSLETLLSGVADTEGAVLVVRKLYWLFLLGRRVYRVIILRARNMQHLTH